MKEAQWLGTSLKDVKAFPPSAARAMGYQIYRVQKGLNPDSYDDMPAVGKGVKEIRERINANAYRVIYLATRPEAVYILHAFQKKTQKTEKRDIDLAKARLKEIP